MEKKRNYKIDNIRFILIFLVVLCHFFEQVLVDTPNDLVNNIYRVIYSFHMPLFIFITGYFAKFKLKKVFLRYIVLYIAFQILYCLFMKKPLQFTRPYWLLWFIFLMPIYSIIIIGFKKLNTIGQFVCILATIGLSLGIGYCDNIGYFLSLSRFFTFLPFFLLGSFVGNLKNISIPKIVKKSGMCVSIITIAFSTYFILNSSFPNEVLYGSYSYSSMNYNPLIKFELFIVSCSWILFFMCWMPKFKIKFISILGMNTLWIYLLHGFFVNLSSKDMLNIFNHSLKINLIIAVALSLGIVIVFGHKKLEFKKLLGYNEARSLEEEGIKNG